MFFPEPGSFDPHEPSVAAHEVRRAWRLPVGPVDDVTALIEAAGGIVLRVDFGTADATAAFISSFAGGRLWFLVNSRETSGDRIRLSLAHELGHAVLHRFLPGYDESEAELQAFTFATALLLPQDHFDAAVPFNALTLTEARALKRLFGVSIQAIVRAAYLRGRIGRDRYTSLYKQISARNWRSIEPDQVPVEVPQVWADVLRVHRDIHHLSDEEIAGVACVNAKLLADLFPENFTFRPRLRAVTSSVRSIGDSAVA